MPQTMQLNQFNQSPIVGDSATKVNLNTLSVQIDPNSTNTLVPGDAVVMTTTAGTTILVDKALATQDPFGFVFYSVKKDQFKAGDSVEIGLVGAIMYVEADGSISRGNNLEYVPAALATGPRMLVSGGTNPISGLALDNATDTEVFRMIVIGTAAVSGTFSGGTINNTPIGGSTPSTGAFTTLSATGATTTKTLADAIVVLTPASAISVDPTLGGLYTLVPAGSETLNMASVPAKHQRLVLVITTSGTSSFTITFGTGFKSTGTLATGTVSGKVFVVVFDCDGVNFNEASRSTAE